jgi:integrase
MSVRKRPPRYRKDGSVAPPEWQADFTVNGQRVVKQFPTQREAKAYERRSKDSADKGAFTAPRRDGETVADAGKAYIKWCRGEEIRGVLRKQTVDYYELLILHHINARFIDIKTKKGKVKARLGDVKLSNLLPPMVEQWRDDLVATGKGVTAVHTLIQLKLLLRNAKRLGWVSYNAAGDVVIRLKFPPKPLPGQDFPNNKEALMLMKGAEGYLRPILITLLSTGMRQGELRALTWDNIDFERRRIRVEHTIDRFRERGPTKTDSGVRTIRMVDILAQALCEWKDICPQGLIDADGRPIRFYIPEHQVLEIAEFLKENPGVSDRNAENLFDVCRLLIRRVRKAMPLAQSGRSLLIFPNTENGARDGSSVWRQFRTLQRELGMVRPDATPKYTLHDLRHYRTSLELRNGHPLADLAQALGHKDASMIHKVYGHPLGDPEGGLAEADIIGQLGLLFLPRPQQK